MGFEFTWTARSSSIDETSHIYFPELFRLVDEGIEALLAEIGFPLSRLIPEERRALPIVHAEADFLSPIAFGDTVTSTLVPSVGESSVSVRASGTVGGEAVYEATVVRVFVDADSFEKRPIPVEMADGLGRYGE